MFSDSVLQYIQQTSIVTCDLIKRLSFVHKNDMKDVLNEHLINVNAYFGSYSISFKRLHWDQCSLLCCCCWVSDSEKECMYEWGEHWCFVLKSTRIFNLYARYTFINMQLMPFKTFNCIECFLPIYTSSVKVIQTVRKFFFLFCSMSERKATKTR